MAGLLDFLQSPDSQLGIGLLAAGGPTTDPNQTGFGQRLASGLQYVDAQRAQDLRMKMMQSQMDENISQAAYRKAMTDQMARKIAMQQGALGMLQGNPVPDVGTPLPSSPVTAPIPPIGFPTVSSGQADPYIRAVRTTESNGNPNAVSPKGAAGDMQVMPGTASSPGFGIRPSDGSQGDTSRVGREYFAALNQKYGDPAIAAVAYNWGPGNTDLWLKNGGDPRKLPAETRNYVTDVLTRGGVNRTAGVQDAPPMQAPSQAPIAAPSSRLAQMTPDQLAAWRIAELPDISKEWEIAKFGKTAAPGSMIDMGDGRGYQFMGDPSKGMDRNGRLTPGFITDQAALSGATKGAEANANYENSPIKIRLNDGTEVTTTPAEIRRNGGSVPGSTQPPVGFKTGASNQEQSAAAFGNTMATKQADILDKSYSSANDAASNIQGIQESRKAMQSGAFQGTGADAKLAVVKFGASLGFNLDPEKATNTDYLKSTLGNGLLEKAKTLGSNPSNADASRITDIVGSIGKDPGAMAKILDWQEQMARKAITQHNTKIDQADANGFKTQFDMHVKMPEASPPTASGKQAGKPPIPMKGMIQDGYKYKGGDPGNPASWEKM